MNKKVALETSPSDDVHETKKEEKSKPFFDLREDKDKASPRTSGLRNAFCCLSASPEALSLLLSHNNKLLLPPEVSSVFLSLSDYLLQHPFVLLRSFVALDENVFLPDKDSLARCFAFTLLSNHCHGYLHSIVGSFLLHTERSPLLTQLSLRDSTDPEDFYQPQRRELLKRAFLDFLEFLLPSLLELQDETRKIFALFSVTAEERKIQNWRKAIRSLVSDLFFSRFLGQALGNPTKVFCFKSKTPGILAFSSVLERLIRDAVEGQLEWLTEDGPYLQRVSDRFRLMEDFLLSKPGKLDAEKHLEKNFVKYMTAWEQLHHECRRERGRMTCVDSEVAPEDASRRLGGWISGLELQEGQKRGGEFELLEKVSDLLAKNKIN